MKPEKPVDPFGLGEIMKGITNAAARAHGVPEPFHVDPDVKARSTHLYEQGRAEAEELGLA